MAAKTSRKAPINTSEALDQVAAKAKTKDAQAKISAFADGTQAVNEERTQYVLAQMTMIKDRIDYNDEDMRIIRIPLSKMKPSKLNPRSQASFTDGTYKFETLKHSFKNGWDIGHPATVHDNGDGTYEILCGHRRHAAATSVDPNGTAPCLVLKGLSRAQKLKLVLDHEQTEGLTEAERFTTFKRLVENKYTRQQICIIMALFKKSSDGREIDNYAFDNFWRRLIMPPAVLKAANDYIDNGAKAARDIPFKPTVENLKILEKAINADNAAKYAGATENGPAYVEALEKLKASSVDENGISEPTGAYKADDLNNLGTSEHRLILKRVFLRLAGKSDEKIGLSSLLDVIRYALDKTFGVPKDVDAIELSDIEDIINPPTVDETDSKDETPAASKDAYPGKLPESTNGKTSASVDVKPDTSKPGHVSKGRKAPAPVKAKKK